MIKNKNIFDVVIIGGGIHGCSTALHIADLGLTAAVIEKDYVAKHASGVNAGGVRQLGRALPEIPISNLSSKLWDQIETLTDDNCGFKKTGQVKVAENCADFKSLKERVKLVLKMGFKHEQILTYDELYDRIPSLAPNCIGGVIVKEDGYADPYRTTQAFKKKALSLGVKFFEENEVISANQINQSWLIKTQKKIFSCKNVVNCAGAWGQKIAQYFGDFAPISAYAPMLMVTSPLPKFLDPVVGSQSRPISFKQLPNGSVLIGGGYLGYVEPKSNQTNLNFKQLSKNIKVACSLFPIIKKATILRAWAGIEGYTPDKLPIISPGRGEGVFHAFGFSAHGFQMAPAVGKILSDIIVNNSNNYILDAFRVDRFTNKRPL